MSRRCFILLVTILAATAVAQDSLTVVSCESDSVIATIQAGERRAMVWHPADNAVYFFSEGMDSLLVVDCESDSAVAGGRFWAEDPAVIDTIDSKLYAVSYNDICVYDCVRQEYLGQISTGFVSSLAWHPVRNRLYAGGTRFSVIDCSADTVLVSRNTNSEVSPVCLLAEQGKVYFGCPDSIWVLDAESDSFVGHFRISGKPGWIGFDPLRDLVYCLAHGRYDSAFVIDPDRDSVLRSFPLRVYWVPYTPPSCLSPQLNRLYVADAHTVYVYDCSTGTELAEIDVDELNVMVLDTIDQKLYTIEDYSYNNVIRVVDCRMNLLVDSIRTGGMEPFGLVWAPTVNKLYCGVSTLMHAIGEQKSMPGTTRRSCPSAVLRGPVLPQTGSRIVDIQGRDVTDEKHRLAPGIYFVRSAASVRKVVIQR